MPRWWTFHLAFTTTSVAFCLPSYRPFTSVFPRLGFSAKSFLTFLSVQSFDNSLILLPTPGTNTAGVSHPTSSPRPHFLPCGPSLETHRQNCQPRPARLLATPSSIRFLLVLTLLQSAEDTSHTTHVLCSTCWSATGSRTPTPSQAPLKELVVLTHSFIFLPLSTTWGFFF